MDKYGTIVSVLLNFFIALFVLCIFSFLRTKFDWIYAPRKLPKNRTHGRPEPKPCGDGWFDWIRTPLKMSEDAIFSNCGLDALMMLRFFSVCLKTYLWCSAYGIAILIPLDYTTTNPDLTNSTGSFDTISMSNVPKNSDRIWAHLISAYLFTFAIFYYMYETYRDYVHFRHRYLVEQFRKGENLTLLVTHLPSTINPLVVHSQQQKQQQTPLIQLPSSSDDDTQNVKKEKEDSNINPKKSSKQTSSILEQPFLHEKLPPHSLSLPLTTSSTSSSSSSLLTNASLDLRSKHSDPRTRMLNLYFRELFGDRFLRATIPQDLTQLKNLITKREQIITSLEHAHAVFNKTNQKQQIALTCCCYNKVDAIEHLTHELQECNNNIENELKIPHAYANESFITFRSVFLVDALPKLSLNDAPFQFQMKMAPEYNDIYWPNLFISSLEKIVRWWVINVSIFFLIAFYFIPVGFVLGLANLNTLAEKLPFLSPVLNFSPTLKGLIEGFLPPLVLAVALALVPIILYECSKQKGYIADSWMHMSVLRSYFFFQLIDFFFVSLIAGSFFQVASELVDNPTSIVSLLGKSLPEVSSFFVSYILLNGLSGYPLKLLRLGPLIVGTLKKKYTCKTKRELEQVEESTNESINYGVEYPPILVVFVIAMTYSSISPVVLPFAVIYFCLAYLVFLYQMLYVFVPKYETGGKFWPLVFDRMIAGVLIYQLTLIGLFGLKEAPTAGSLSSPLPFITYAFYRYTNNAFKGKSECLTVEEAITADQGKPCLQHASHPTQKKFWNFLNPFSEQESSRSTLDLRANDDEEKETAVSVSNTSPVTIRPLPSTMYEQVELNVTPQINLDEEHFQKQTLP